ncbi:putative tetratricopeptide-like helical domain-containing protein [Rosa chinensis]|uniref:Putative tetratricopeptide-like helical domain-containing protein n=1 Tax=Rosa chinensis TaxID=74649 RepID=A0A2P6QVP4_ROSCH|nr:putative pentatricopeptide repeat-containing protein At3g15130 [Rosa chinensis]XP_040373683.1 putative pentatricopeptide repeat-containing protein At3g15130 [Rosa chinensis]PRQ38219.1 putative tetratricopeptide-like helical domain-containing protein [Rosa chinensis]
MIRSSPRAVLETTYRLVLSKSTHNLATLEQTCSDLLRTCAQSSDLPNGRAIHAKLFKGSLPFSPFLQNHLLNMYVKCGHLNNALQLFDEMPERNVVSWSALIKGFVQHGCPNEGLSLFGRMHRDGTAMPNEFTLVSSLQACSLCGNLTQAYQVYAFIVRLGFEWNVFLTNALLTVLVRHGELTEALQVFENCPNKDIVSWNAIMAGYLEYDCSEVATFWWRMNREGVTPDSYTFSSVLTGLAAVTDLKMGVQVHGQLVRYGHGAEICVGNSLADMYIKNHQLLDGFKAFHEMPFKDVCSWTEMAAGCLQCGEPSKALEVIAQMKKVGIQPNKFTLATALNACANLASLEEGKKFHALRIKLETCTDVDVCVDNALLDMYAKCGCMDGARSVFELMKDSSVVSWTTMIMGCAQNGKAREALEIFDKMRLQEGIEPNYITFICVLYACSQGGFIDEGWKYFASMTQNFGITPGEDHYACMVDLLGRAGRIKEAEELIKNMPLKPGVLVWQTLLGACQLLGDTETGKRAAEHALEINRTEPSTYILLSNIFAGLSNWDSVGMLRKLMDSRDVKKLPGSSWIEH